MAWNNEDVHQKHQKVYNFMKRNLPQERYDGLRAVEPCVVISDEFNKAFKFAVIGEDAIFVTENPPKHSKDIRIEINLASVTELRWINDVPEFLSGEVRENAIHIMVCYNKPVCHITTLASQSNSTTSLSKTTLSSTTPKASTQSIPKAHSYSNLNQDVVQAGSCVPICRRPLPPPPKGFEDKTALSMSQERLINTKDAIPSVRIEETRKKGRRERRSRSLASSGHSDDMDFSSVDALNLSSRSADFNIKRTNNHDKRLSNSASSAELASQLRRTANFSIHDTLTIPEGAGGGSRPLPKKYFGTKTAYDIAQEKMNETEKAIVHLYILTKHSNFFMHMRSSWNNCLLKYTLLGDEKQAGSSRPPSRAKPDSGQLLQLFTQLKSEILSSHQMEQSFCLIQEMCVASKRSSLIKKMFWKTSELFMFLINQLELFHYKSPRRGKHKSSNRADELDYVVVLLDTLAEMFRETEMLTSRLNVLKSNKCQAVADLVRTIIPPPQTQTPMARHGREVSREAKALLGGSKLMKETASQEKELQSLLPEITHHDIALLFELATAAHQANWFTTENTSLSVSWVVKILETHEQIESFIKRLMDYMVSLVSSSEELLTKEQAVSLYQQFTILKHCIDYSPKLSDHLCHQFAEEFRYYVRHQVLISKLPEEFPLTSPLVNLINNVMAHVLEVKTKKKTKNYLRE